MSIDSPAVSNRPQVRCPACGELVFLPAPPTCPDCQADMKTGFRPERSFFHDDPEIIKVTIKAFLLKRGKKLLLLLIPLLGVLYLFFDPGWFGPKKSFFERMVILHPAVARPYVASQKARYDGKPGSSAYQRRLVSELRKNSPPTPTDELMITRYAHMKPSQQVKVVMRSFAAVAAERIRGHKYGRLSGGHWSVIRLPYGNEYGRVEYSVNLHLIVNDPRVYNGYSFIFPINPNNPR